ncbi:bifunctional NAD(P)H-hydrate repair enzyme [Betaproteobacteria bacterium]|nr:bifunctional NAD(P)H-hydrate repair enzyme [Betaproteobacteria bacterium]
MSSTALYRSPDLRLIETAAADQRLMLRAGRAGADLAAAIRHDSPSPVLILAGPGNNGGDAFELARLLRERFLEVAVVFTGDAVRLPADAADAFRRFSDAGGVTCAAIPGDMSWSLIVDGLFGIGLTRDITGAFAGLIAQANILAERDHCPLLALDCPSGLDADTGVLHGTGIRASHTITFIAAKPGLFTADGPDHCGEVTVAALDLDPSTFKGSPGRIVSRAQFANQLRPRRRNTHKGSYGNAGILGGATGMVGAALLCARAALRLGSGRVYLGLLDGNAPSLDPLQPELMIRRPEQLLTTELSVLACGPGMGNNAEVIALIEKACSLDIPLVLDADALNRIAGNEQLRQAVKARRAPALLTPHPTEAARLLACNTQDVQNDRIAAACQLAADFDAFVALKGCGTVIAEPGGAWSINTSGNPGLATAGSGDVLTGMVCALLAQGWPSQQALPAAVHLHGLAADHLVNQGKGPVGLTAGELIDSARDCLNQCTR